MTRTIAAVGLVLMLAAPAQASEHPRVDRCRGTSSVGRMVRCVARSFDSPGTPRYAEQIGRCESGLRPRAVSASGTYIGLFQHARTQWLARWHHWGRPLGVGRAWWNALSAAVVSVRMARVATWSPWSCS